MRFWRTSLLSLPVILFKIVVIVLPICRLLSHRIKEPPMPNTPVISTFLKDVRVVKSAADAMLLSPERNFLHILMSMDLLSCISDGKVLPLSRSVHSLRRESLYFTDNGSGPSGSEGIHETSRGVTSCKKESPKINMWYRKNLILSDDKWSRSNIS